MECNKITYNYNCHILVKAEEFNPDFVEVYILLLNKYSGHTISQTFIKTKAEDLIEFTLGEDGYYTLCLITVPRDPFKPYYYKNGHFFKESTEVSIDELLSVNPKISELKIEYNYYFLLCNLKKCFIEYSSNYLNKKVSILCNDETIDKLETYKRDLLLVTINVINYLVEMKQFEEAERILEKVSGCNGLCKSVTYKEGCGCGG